VKVEKLTPPQDVPVVRLELSYAELSAVREALAYFVEDYRLAGRSSSNTCKARIIAEALREL
jgi:hypothetical protein